MPSQKSFRKPTKMGTFSVGGVNPTRVNPQTAKRVTSDISFFKTICRVVLNYGDTDYSSKQVADIVHHHMPFIKNHYRKIRGDIDEWRHMDKEVRDAVNSDIRTMKKYKPPYPSSSLSKRKQQEVLFAVEVLEKDMILKEGDVAERLGPLRDDL